MERAAAVAVKCRTADQAGRLEEELTLAHERLERDLRHAEAELQEAAQRTQEKVAQGVSVVLQLQGELAEAQALLAQKEARQTSELAASERARAEAEELAKTMHSHGADEQTRLRAQMREEVAKLSEELARARLQAEELQAELRRAHLRGSDMAKQRVDEEERGAVQRHQLQSEGARLEAALGSSKAAHAEQERQA